MTIRTSAPNRICVTLAGKQCIKYYKRNSFFTSMMLVEENFPGYFIHVARLQTLTKNSTTCILIRVSGYRSCTTTNIVANLFKTSKVWLCCGHVCISQFHFVLLWILCWSHIKLSFIISYWYCFIALMKHLKFQELTMLDDQVQKQSFLSSKQY